MESDFIGKASPELWRCLSVIPTSKDESSGEAFFLRLNGKIGDDKPSRKVLLAHRVSFQIHFGDIPDGLFICHKCDNPKCVNPSHLFAGTNKDNVQDMILKQRDYRGIAKIGASHPMAKLSERQVINILSDNRSLSQIAKDYSISKSYVSSLKKGRTWKHINLK